MQMATKGRPHQPINGAFQVSPPRGSQLVNHGAEPPGHMPAGRHFLPLVHDPTQLLQVGLVHVPEPYLGPSCIPTTNDQWRSQTGHSYPQHPSALAGGSPFGPLAQPQPMNSYNFIPPVPYRPSPPSSTPGTGAYPTTIPAPQPPAPPAGPKVKKSSTSANPQQRTKKSAPGPEQHQPGLHDPSAPSSRGRRKQAPSPSTTPSPAAASTNPPLRYPVSSGPQAAPAVSNGPSSPVSSSATPPTTGLDDRDDGQGASEEDQAGVGTQQSEAVRERERKQAEKYEETYGKNYQPTTAWARLDDGHFVCHVSRLIFSTAVQSVHHLSKTIYKTQLAASALQEDPLLIAEIERLCAEEKERLHTQKFSIIKQRNAMHQELRVEAAKLAKAKRKLEHELTLAKNKIEKMQSQHERQLEFVRASYQRKLDRLLRELAARDPLANLQELAEQSDLHKDLQRYCFEPYDWAPPCDMLANGDEPPPGKPNFWSSIVDDVDAAPWGSEGPRHQYEEDRRPANKSGHKAPGSPLSDFAPYSEEPYSWVPLPSDPSKEGDDSPARDPWRLATFDWSGAWPANEEAVEAPLTINTNTNDNNNSASAFDPPTKVDPIASIRNFIFRPSGHVGPDPTLDTGDSNMDVSRGGRRRSSSVPGHYCDGDVHERRRSLPLPDEEPKDATCHRTRDIRRTSGLSIKAGTSQPIPHLSTVAVTGETVAPHRDSSDSIFLPRAFTDPSISAREGGFKPQMIKPQTPNPLSADPCGTLFVPPNDCSSFGLTISAEPFTLSAIG